MDLCRTYHAMNSPSKVNHVDLDSPNSPPPNQSHPKAFDPQEPHVFPSESPRNLLYIASIPHSEDPIVVPQAEPPIVVEKFQAPEVVEPREGHIEREVKRTEAKPFWRRWIIPLVLLSLLIVAILSGFIGGVLGSRRSKIQAVSDRKSVDESALWPAEIYRNSSLASSYWVDTSNRTYYRLYFQDSNGSLKQIAWGGGITFDNATVSTLKLPNLTGRFGTPLATAVTAGANPFVSYPCSPPYS
jgi:hypothetical protein